MKQEALTSIQSVSQSSSQDYMYEKITFGYGITTEKLRYSCYL